MSPYDILMLVIFAIAILFGLWKGLAWQIASIAAIVVSYFVALNFKQPLVNLMGIEQPWAPFLAMLIIYLLSSLGIWLAYGYIRESIKRMHLKSFDSQAGALLGAVKGTLLCMVITMFSVTLFGDNARRYVVNSYSGNLIARSINRLNAVVPSELHQVLDPFVNRFNEQLAQPLPPVSNDSSTQGGLVGQFNEMIQDFQSGSFVEGSFMTQPSSANPSGGNQFEFVPELNVDVDTDKIGNEIRQGFNDRLNRWQSGGNR